MQDCGTVTEVADLLPTAPETQPPLPAPRRRTARLGSRRHGEIMVWLVAFVALLAIFTLGNRHLFSTPVYPDGDYAANAIIIEDATRFDLLVGNYSRQGFFHPGPATFYVQAAGQTLLHDLTGLVPAPFNGQALALLVLNAALVALVVGIVWSHTRTAAAALTTFAVVLGFAAYHAPLLVSTWMPRVYVAPFLLLMVAGASVGRGTTRHLWCVVLATGLLLHGHAAFVYFTAVTAFAVAAALWRTWRNHGPRVRLARPHIVAAAAVAAIFALPIVVNLMLRWPGEFDDYLAYSSASQAGGHSPGEALDYTSWYWWQNASTRGPVIALLVAAAVAVVVRHRRPATRRFLGFCLGAAALETALVFVYAIRGIDYLDLRYIGYFSWAVPLVVMLVLAVGALPAAANRRVTALAGAAAVAVVVVALAAGGLTDGYRGSSELPALVESLAAQRAQRAQFLVLEIIPEEVTWAAAVAVLVEADRRGIPACIVNADLIHLMTDRFLCDRRQVASGLALQFVPPGTASRPVGRTYYADVVRTEVGA